MGAAVSTYGAAETYQPDGSNRFTLREYLRPIEGMANFVNASYLPPFSLSDVGNVTDEQLEQSKSDYVWHIDNAQGKILDAAYARRKEYSN
ncbi:NAD(P)H-dependent oxidoreductase [Paenibacillus solisilvae]|uniref:NAD(P)H-dependent oxidoreductase n=1 Tax=Paenibacillus solisilvae TaxID=2486751 RepID=A0ABW0VVT4_9BACL